MNKVPIQVMDITTLKAVVFELRQDIVPSRFETAQQIDPYTIQLGFRTLEKLTWIEISWLAESPRIVSIPPPKRYGEKSTLARQLKHLLGNFTTYVSPKKHFRDNFEKTLFRFGSLYS